MREDRDVNRNKQSGTRGPRRRQTPLTCDFCWRVFARKEHLTRHLRVHTRERPFTCETCGKEFSRMDILNRHTRIHTQQQPEIATSRTQRSAACLQCATSRVRCTRGDPCARCESKGLSCEHRVLSARRRRVGSGEDRVAERDAHVSRTEQAPTTSPEPGAVLGEGVDWQGLRDAYSGNALDLEMTYGLGMYEVDPTNEFAPRPLSAINWLSPDDRNIQEWASQLAGIPDGGVFPTSTTVAMPAVPSLPQLLGTEPTLGWAPASQSSTDNAQIETLAAMTSCPEGTERQSSETLMDGASSRSSQSTGKRYYVHGIAWRAPFQSRFRKGRVMGSVDKGSVTTSAPSTTSIGSVTNIDGTASSLSQWLAEDVYDDIVSGVEEETQASSSLPSLPAFRLCVHLYFERLHPNLPFLSRASFISEKPHWILALAVAGVGAAYLRFSQGSQWKDILMQALEGILLRRLHQFRHKVDPKLPTTSTFETANEAEELLPLIQAKVLHLLCMLHSYTSYITQRAVFDRAELVQWCSSLNLVPDSVGIFGLSTSGKDIQQWKKVQSSLRTGMMIWLLDSMVSYELNCNHLMKLGDARGWLPCHEMAWENPSAENIAYAESVSISLLDALDLIYIEKRFPRKLSQFSQVLLIHAIYRRTTEVADQSRIQLSSWSPTDSAQISSPRPASTQVMWPPSSSILVKWRNAACDSLDVLHCAANSRAAESCWEEPTILYLHLARLLILSPFMHFQTLAQDPLLRTRNGPSVNVSHLERFENARSQVFQWAIRDQFKARLSVVHAGALLWHVRRFSTDNVVEPFAVYIATLLLWAYSLSVKTVRAQGSTTHQNASCSHPPSHDQIPGDASLVDEDNIATDQSDAEPRFIYLDRPLDDELVQMYIRVGNKVSAQLKGVGDISSDTAPVKILKQGYYLLTGERYVGQNSSSTTAGEVIFRPWNIQQLYAATIRWLVEAS